MPASQSCSRQVSQQPEITIENSAMCTTLEEPGECPREHLRAVPVLRRDVRHSRYDVLKREESERRDQPRLKSQTSEMVCLETSELQGPTETKMSQCRSNSSSGLLRLGSDAREWAPHSLRAALTDVATSSPPRSATSGVGKSY